MTNPISWPIEDPPDEQLPDTRDLTADDGQVEQDVVYDPPEDADVEQRDTGVVTTGDEPQ